MTGQGAERTTLSATLPSSRARHAAARRGWPSESVSTACVFASSTMLAAYEESVSSTVSSLRSLTAASTSCPQLRLRVFHGSDARRFGRQEHLAVSRHRRGDERIVEDVDDPDVAPSVAASSRAWARAVSDASLKSVGTRIRVIRIVPPPRKDGLCEHGPCHAGVAYWRSSDRDRAPAGKFPRRDEKFRMGRRASTGRLIPTVPPSFEPVTVEARKPMRRMIVGKRPPFA